MSPSSLLIRRAGPDDAEASAKLSAATFTETFGHLYPPEDLLAFLTEHHTVEVHRRVLASEAHGTWFVEADGEPVGIALAGPCSLPHPEVREEDGELKRLYLLKRVQNAGHGERLFRTAIEWLERDGPRTLWIGVWSENHGAQRFYARHGFVRVGEYKFPVGRVRDHEFILRRAPRPPA
ncbi:acetyltransferase [Cystobacter fuscus]|uniref:Acetyltransferase n=1 Tax=Cystobacter fuscus TaxID=43 RepID=A0A250JFI5_9BACT|nr:GNAT family N-acetyltransferase [Cystobacter fuscus]ATB42659.1 acetyltransferase [Cystobacter fuscus]